MITNEGEKTAYKVRGIALNYDATKLVFFDVIRAMILEQGEPVVNVHTEIKSYARDGHRVR